MAIRILVADDNTLIRREIRTIIEFDEELEVCAEAVNGLEAVEKAQESCPKAQESCPDVAVIDCSFTRRAGLQVLGRFSLNSPERILFRLLPSSVGPLALIVNEELGRTPPDSLKPWQEHPWRCRFHLESCLSR